MLYLLLRSRKDPLYRQRLAERFAWQRVPARALGGIVVHAVSMGEVVAATPLIKALQQQYPQLTLTVTCTTPTGSARIVSTFADSVYHCYLPLDTPGAVQLPLPAGAMKRDGSATKRGEFPRTSP